MWGPLVDAILHEDFNQNCTFSAIRLVMNGKMTNFATEFKLTYHEKKITFYSRTTNHNDAGGVGAEHF